MGYSEWVQGWEGRGKTVNGPLQPVFVSYAKFVTRSVLHAVGHDTEQNVVRNRAVVAMSV